MSRGLSRDDAYMLVSVACDVNDTQLVDGNVGVHVMIPKAIFTKHTASHVAPPAASPAASHRR
jgi:acetamidase/formamidase